MTLDHDLRDRFDRIAPTISDIDQGAAGARRASGRRNGARPVAAIVVALIAIVGGYTLLTGLTDDTSSEIFTTDPPDSLPDEIAGDTDGPTNTTTASTDPPEPLAGGEPTTDGADTADGAGPSTAAAEAIVSEIVGVEPNDTLNARSGPGTSFDVLFEFAHDAAGIVQTGQQETANDGALWVEVFAPTSGTGFDAGWVNANFLSETTVLDASPCVFNGPQDHYIGIDWVNTEGSSESEASAVSNIETYRFGGCIRTVIEFASGLPFAESPEPATSLPDDIVVTRDTPTTIDFGTSISAADFDAVSERFDEAVVNSVFVSLGTDGRLDGAVYGPTNTTWVVFDNQSGRMTIDVADIRLPLDAEPELVERVGAGVQPFIAENDLVITGVSHTSDRRLWTISGLARPFENQMSVGTTDLDGEPLNVTWAGTPFSGDSTDNMVMPTTWIEALGQFWFSITLPDDVEPADVVIEFDISQPPDDQEFVALRLADFDG